MKHLFTLFCIIAYLLSGTLLAQNCTDPNLVQVIVQLVPDTWANTETSWSLTNIAGETLATGTSAGDTICVNANACIHFNIQDTYGDGLIQGGFCNVYYNGETIAEYGNFGYNAHTEFGNCPAGTSCFFPISFTNDMLNQTQTIAPGNTWYAFVPDTTGIYKISICGLGNICAPTVWVYDHCSNLVWDNTQIGSLYVTNGNCDEQAVLNTYLAANTTYYIRIDNINDCMPTTNFWNMWFDGAISGCMDITACNYDPLAAIPLPNSCIYPGDPACPGGPDLVVVQEAIANSLSVSEMDNNDGCLIAEACVSGYGTRELLRFTTHIKNIGTKDYYIGNVPSSTSTSSTQFEWSPCHNHWHYSGYAEYLLYDQNDVPLPAGFKNGFCVMDLECSGGGTAKFGCSEMGISAGCGDIYDSGLGCQWVDITDIPDGFYKLIVRVNWDNSPDNLGYYELNHTNNWAQVCFNLTHDASGAHVMVVDDCPIVADCLGEPYGNAIVDCTGTCGGTQLRGDLDNDGILHTNDALAYLNYILDDNNTPATNCNDICDDGIVDIADAALLTACVLQNNSTHIDPVGTPPHSHCNFPVQAIVNPFDTATLSIVNINPAEKYFEIAIKNPSVYVLDYQLQLFGVEVIGAFNTITGNGYNIDIFFNGSGTILGLSPTETPLNRFTTPTVFLRVYYSSITQDQVCLVPMAMINVLYEHIVMETENACFDAYLFTGQNDIVAPNPLQVSIAPNPFNKVALFRFVNPQHTPHTLLIYNIAGKEVARYNNITNNQIELHRNNWSAGVYYYHLIGTQSQIGRFVVSD